MEELRRLESLTPERQTTQIRQAANGELLAQLETSLLNLELKRTDLLAKYDPAYPPVQEIEKQIQDAEAAIATAQQSPVEETTTDRVPAQDWIAAELAKAEADRAATDAQAAAMARAAAGYRAAVLTLDQKGAEQADLLRNVKTAEENYLLYMRKREAARISDALDSKRIVNVSIAEAATVPALPTLGAAWLLAAGFFSAGLLGVGAAYVADRLNPGFRSPEELGRYLDLRVLAAIPATAGQDVSQVSFPG
jgi:uncharacterized protein involved in exopolysaccharide biosynthesis